MKKIIISLAMLALSVAGGAQAQSNTNGAALRVSFAQAVEAAGPAVVNIYSTKITTTRDRVNPFSDDPFFQNFFNDFGITGQLKQRVERSLGSGVVLTKEGHLVTNYHVVDGAQEVRVVFSDGHEYPARMVASDEQQDIAIMQLDLPDDAEVTPAIMGESHSLAVGDVVLAVGNPYGFGQSVSMGVVSAVGRSNVSGGPLASYIQTDAAINPGNSGGALIDSNGHVVGINTVIFSKTGANTGIGFAVPIESVAAAMESVMKSGEIKHPWIGVEGQDVTRELSDQLGLSRPYGVLVHTVLPTGPGAKGDIRVGDVILAVANLPVTDSRGLVGVLSQQRLEQDVALTLWREGQEIERTVRLEAVPARPAGAEVILKGAHPLAGYAAEELSTGLNYELDLPLAQKGVAITQVPARQAFGVYLQPGDVVEKVNGSPIGSMADLQRELGKQNRAWSLLLLRNGQRVNVAIQY